MKKAEDRIEKTGDRRPKQNIEVRR